MNHYTRWLELKEQNPGKYARDIAGLMNIREAELAFARVTHDAWRMNMQSMSKLVRSQTSI